MKMFIINAREVFIKPTFPLRASVYSGSGNNKKKRTLLILFVWNVVKRDGLITTAYWYIYIRIKVSWGLNFCGWRQKTTANSF